jgi:hypothetical protein
MLRGFLIIWLIVSNLGYGMTLLADVHQSTGLDADHQGSHHVTPELNDHEEGVDCDHCCHGLIHLLGLVDSMPSAPPVCSGHQPSGYLPPFTLAPSQRPFRPPITA